MDINFERASTKLDSAIAFAALAHAGQKRKYPPHIPYIVHPIDVMKILGTVTEDDEMLMAAVLHDTVEDTPVAHRDIERRFGVRVAALVFDMTDKPVEGNRAVRKNAERIRWIDCSDDAKTIKIADMISNTKDIVKHDARFAPVYLEEKRALLPSLDSGSHKLLQRAQRQLVKGLGQLELARLIDGHD